MIREGSMIFVYRAAIVAVATFVSVVRYGFEAPDCACSGGQG
jgi:hypothetical protein